MSTLLEDNIFTSNYFGRNAKSKSRQKGDPQRGSNSVKSQKKKEERLRERSDCKETEIFEERENLKKKQRLDSWLKGDQMCFKLVWSPSTSCLGFKSHLFESLSLFVISYQTSKGPFEISVKGGVYPQIGKLLLLKNLKRGEESALRVAMMMIGVDGMRMEVTPR